VWRVDDEDWVRRSQAQFGADRISARLWIVPSWHEPPDARRVVRLDPGLAFGTGSHVSTRLVLRSCENDRGAGERVLDYGCGSGILAIVAAKLGAAQVDATDIDPQALRNRRRTQRQRRVGRAAAR
jgi:ribosomal protein L11 methyltransferase